MTHPSATRRWIVALAPLLLNLTIATVLRLILPLTLAPSGERHLYYLMSLLVPVPGCDSFHCFRIVPPLVARLLPFDGAVEVLVGMGSILSTHRL